MVGEHFIYGAIGFLIGGILGAYFAGRTCAREYKRRIGELQTQCDSLVDENHKATERALSDRQKGLLEAEKKIDAKLKPRKLSTARLEKLSKEYGSESFDRHFAERVAPDDSDEDEDEADDVEDICDADVDFDDPFDEEERSDIRMLNPDEYNLELKQRGDCRTYTYYQEDGVLVDDATQEVERDQEGVLGEDVMGMICDTDEDFLYIDNGPDKALYEISVDHKMSYYRDVCGLG